MPILIHIYIMLNTILGFAHLIYQSPYSFIFSEIKSIWNWQCFLKWFCRWKIKS